MIDEIDIRKAATLTYNPALDAVANFAARNAFAAGVEWFKKALWHTKDEIPEADRLILVKGRTDGTCGDYGLVNIIKDLDLADFDRKSQWKSICELADFDFTWCYVEDLLPKGGGND